MNKVMQEPLGLMREIYRAYKAEMAAVASYTYGQILLERAFPVLSDLLASIARAEMRHYHALGELLRDLGASHALKVTLQDFAYRGDPDSLELVDPLLKDRIRYEKNAAEHYRRLALAATTEPVKRVLLVLAHEEEEHATALEATAARLKNS